MRLADPSGRGKGRAGVGDSCLTGSGGPVDIETAVGILASSCCAYKGAWPWRGVEVWLGEPAIPYCLTPILLDDDPSPPAPECCVGAVVRSGAPLGSDGFRIL